MRGRLIAEGAKWKKIWLAQKQTLLKEFQDLEQIHKRSVADPALSKLIEKRQAFKDLMEQETKLAFNLTAKRYYEVGNRPGELLAGTIKPKGKVNYIEKLKAKKGS